jgi:hypothetical protein
MIQAKVSTSYAILGPQGGNGEYIDHWIDVRVAHELGHTALPNSYRHAVHWVDHKTAPGQRAMWDSEKRNRKKYAPLVEAARQHNPAVVLWYVGVFTMQGLLGDETEEIIKIIMGGHAKMLETAPTDREAVPIKSRQASFETNYRNSLAAVCARGHTKLLREVGVPRLVR